MGTVVGLHSEPVKPEPLSISEYSLAIGDETYIVPRAVEAGTQRGFVTIVNEAGVAVLVFSSSFPDEYTEQLIVAWRTGYKRGLDRGRLDGIEIGTARGIADGLNNMLRRRCGMPLSTDNVS